MTRVLAIDPGERVGWATGVIAWEDGVGAVSSDPPLLHVQNHGISHLKEFALKLHKVAGNYDRIVYETWRLRPQMARKFIGSEFPTVQLIGMIRLCAWANGVPVYAQGPDTKATATRTLAAGHHPDIAERIAKLPKVHDEAHDGDALLHLWFHFFKEFK